LTKNETVTNLATYNADSSVKISSKNAEKMA